MHTTLKGHWSSLIIVDSFSSFPTCFGALSRICPRELVLSNFSVVVRSLRSQMSVTKWNTLATKQTHARSCSLAWAWASQQVQSDSDSNSNVLCKGHTRSRLNRLSSRIFNLARCAGLGRLSNESNDADWRGMACDLTSWVFPSFSTLPPTTKGHILGSNRTKQRAHD